VSRPPTFQHGILISRIVTALGKYCDRLGIAQTAAGNAIVDPTGLYMIPDVIITPGRRPLDTAIASIVEWWLAVEVLSPTTRITDTKFKRGAYHEMGVDTVWLIDYEARAVTVTRLDTPGQLTVVTDTLRWQAPGTAVPFELSLAELFRDD
jgi:Uma2 family endonuclease